MPAIGQWVVVRPVATSVPLATASLASTSAVAHPCDDAAHASTAQLFAQARALCDRLAALGGDIGQDAALELELLAHNRAVLKLGNASWQQVPNSELPYVGRGADGVWQIAAWQPHAEGVVTGDGCYLRRPQATSFNGAPAIRILKLRAPPTRGASVDVLSGVTFSQHRRSDPACSAWFAERGMHYLTHESTPAGLLAILQSGALMVPSLHRQAPHNTDGVGYASQQNGDVIYAGAAPDKALAQWLGEATLVFDIALLDQHRYHLSTHQARGKIEPLDPERRQGSAQSHELGRLRLVLDWIQARDATLPLANELVFHARKVPLKKLVAVVVPEAQKAALLAALSDKGISTVAGRPLTSLLMTQAEFLAQAEAVCRQRPGSAS